MPEDDASDRQTDRDRDRETSRPGHKRGAQAPRTAHTIRCLTPPSRSRSRESGIVAQKQDALAEKLQERKLQDKKLQEQKMQQRTRRLSKEGLLNEDGSLPVSPTKSPTKA